MISTVHSITTYYFNIYCLTREERQNFIRSKYIDRHFYVAEEFHAVMKNRPPGEDEDELFNDSAEVS